MRGLISIGKLLPGLLFALAIACGSGGGSSDGASGDAVDEDLFDYRQITSSETIFSVDDLEAVGYKKSRDIDTELLPNALEAWYGFFNQKDIEVWVYESHQEVLEFGLEPAEAIFEIKRAPSSGISVLPTERFVNKYAAYSVYGNLLMLCETELAICEALIAELE
jgi:hypothetical protein